MNKRCPKCGEVKPLEEFGKNRAHSDGAQSYCLPCLYTYRPPPSHQREWYANHKMQARKCALKYYYQNREAKMNHQAKYRQTHPDKCRQSQHKHNQKLKLAVFTAYGGAVCVCCGEANPKFLTIDHINGCGKELRKSHGLGSRFYQWLKKQGYPPGYQVLCYNCNLGRAHNQGICPHKE